MKHLIHFTLFLILFSSSLLAAPKLSSPDQMAIFADVPETIESSHIPSTICFYGPNAFPLIIGETGNAQKGFVHNAVAAAATYEKGHIALLGHTGMVGKDFFKNNPKFSENLIQWLGKNAKGTSKKVAVLTGKETADFLQSQNIPAEYVKAIDGVIDGNVRSQKYSVIICEAGHFKEEHIEKGQQFVADGGGIMIAATGWGWQQGTDKSIVTDFIGAKLTAPMGAIWSNRVFRQPGSGWKPANNVTTMVHPAAAIETLLKDGPEKKIPKPDLPQIYATLDLAFEFAPAEHAPVLTATNQLLDMQIMPSEQNRISEDNHPVEYVAMTLQTKRYIYSQSKNGIPEGVTIPKLAAGDDFPGAVPDDAKRIKKRVSVNPKIPRWHSTGLYAPPGEVITVKIPDNAVKSGKFSVRIGCHTDSLYGRGAWSRYPQISVHAGLKQAETRVANPFGGLIYIEVAGDAPKTLRVFSAEIDGAVESPLYVLGRTLDITWKRSQQAPGPWAELASDSLIITVPSRVVRELENPQEVMAFWNEILDADAWLVGNKSKRKSPERIAVDRQISVGYMHSGYPIGARLDQQATILDVKTLREKGNWGYFHEVGHNHQGWFWRIEGSTEASVNVFTLYNYVKVCGSSIDTCRDNFTPPIRKERKAKYIAEGAMYEQWKSDPMLGLATYMELIEEFGWETFPKVVSQYTDMPKEEQPKDEQEKRDQWMVRYSRVVGRNLGPYFDQWGIPVSAKAKDSVKDLPVWLPEG